MGNGVSVPPKLRPVFLQRLEEIRARRHIAQIKNSTPSKKELLLRGDDDIDHDSTHHEPSSKEDSDRIRPRQETLHNNKYDAKRHEAAKEDLKIVEKGVVQNHRQNAEENLTDYEDADDGNDHDDDDDDKRRIGYDGDDAFPGSPSFRVYFQDDGNGNPDGNNNGFGDHKAPSDDSAMPQDSGPGKKMKKGRKRKSFKMVFPKGGQSAVMNLLNVTSCCSSPDNHHPARLNTGKSDP